MATKGAISFNGIDVTGGHPLDGLPSSQCFGIPEIECTFVSAPIPPIPYSPGDVGVFVNGYQMAAGGMDFGAHELRMPGGTLGCDSLSGDQEGCSIDHEIVIPEISCSLNVKINGVGVALPGVEFSCSVDFPDYKTEIEGGATNVLIYI